MNKHLIELKKTLGKFIANFSVEGNSGEQYIYDGDIAEGVDVFTYGANGDVVALADGDYKIADKDVHIEGGKVKGITEPQATEQEPTLEESQVTEPQNEDPSSFTEKIAELQAEVDGYKAKMAEYEAEIERLKQAPLDEPLPQNTDMSNDTDIPDNIRGTKYEKAYRFFKH